MPSLTVYPDSDDLAMALSDDMEALGSGLKIIALRLMKADEDELDLLRNELIYGREHNEKSLIFFANFVLKSVAASP